MAIVQVEAGQKQNGEYEIGRGPGGGDGGAPDGGVAEAGASDVLACLRAVDPAKLIAWVPAPGATTTGTGARALLDGLFGAPFQPTVEGTGGVLPDTPAHLIASGMFNKSAHVVAGTNTNEFGFFVYVAKAQSSATPLNIAFRTIWLKWRSGNSSAGNGFSHAIDSKIVCTLVRQASAANGTKRPASGTKGSARSVA